MTRRHVLAGLGSMTLAGLGCGESKSQKPMISSVRAAVAPSPAPVAPTVTLRRAWERGTMQNDWLNTNYSFSFANYRDPAHMGFRSLRVMNEDWIKGASGFPTHPHRDMEIVTYVMQGGLQHRDSMGNGGVITPNLVQRMSAGTGIYHSEFNASESEWVHLIQIWILPDRRDHTPSYEQKMFHPQEKTNNLRLVASPDGRDGSLSINADTHIYSALMTRGERVGLDLGPGRHVWLQVANGDIRFRGHDLQAGDGAAISGTDAIELLATTDAEVLVFNLA
jgi:redox-sensitive bicupin YhaK (pirin superfamily)